jgi:hypothetical protein
MRAADVSVRHIPNRKEQHKPMHGLFYEEFARVVAQEGQRQHRELDQQHGPGPPPPNRVRGFLAVWLASAANRVDREAARRALA